MWKNKKLKHLTAQQRERVYIILEVVAIVSIIWMVAILLDGGPDNFLEKFVTALGVISLLFVAGLSAYYA